MDEFEAQEYFHWLEGVMRELSVMEVKAISIEVVESDGSTSTRYWNTTTSDRAMMMAAMEEAQVVDLIADNREMILALLNGEEDDDSLCDE